jgi:hypothetical protein
LSAARARRAVAASEADASPSSPESWDSVKNYVVDILCTGSVIEPEVVAPAFDTDDFGTNRIPEDGQVIANRMFEQLKDERLKHLSK